MGRSSGRPCWNKEKMEELHVDERKNPETISKEIGENKDKVIRWLKKHGIYRGYECPGCGEIFRHIGYHFSHSPSCVPESYEDNPLYQSHQCDLCGDIYYIKNNRGSRSRMSFCSNECRGEWLKRSDTTHPTEFDHVSWRERSDQIRDRDGNKCRVCGMTQQEHREKYSMRLHVHHITPRSEFDDISKADDPGNLITICCRHHLEYEGTRSLAHLIPE